MKTLITLFAIVASLSMMAQSTATKSYNYQLTVINEQKAETTFIQIKQDLKDLLELSITEAGKAWATFRSDNAFILSSGYPAQSFQNREMCKY